jgi:RHS repeat-associated protein
MACLLRRLTAHRARGPAPDPRMMRIAPTLSLLAALLVVSAARARAQSLTVNPKGTTDTTYVASGSFTFQTLLFGTSGPDSAQMTLVCSGVDCSFPGHGTFQVVPVPAGSANWPVNITSASYGGAGTIKLIVTTLHAPILSDSASATILYIPAVHSVTVTVSPDTAKPTPGQNINTTFTVKNVGNVLDTLTFTRTCSGAGAAACAGVSQASAVVKPESTTTVVVNFNGGPAGTNGTIKMSAVDQHSIAVAGVQTAIVAPAVGLDVVDANPGVSFNRANCLTVAVGPHAAFNCGDLRITHPLPAVRTYSKVRAPTLIYNWRFAIPAPNIGALLTVAASATALDSVLGFLYMWPHGHQERTLGIVANGKWLGVDWDTAKVQTTRRIQLSWAAYGAATGPYDFAFVTHRYYHGSMTFNQDSAVGQFILVNRMGSYFGAGWWLSGYEQLVIQNEGLASDGLAVIGGDGSTQWYTKHVSTDSVYYPQTYVGERDSIIYQAAGTYYKRRTHGTTVQFDGHGWHVMTIDRLGHVTYFFQSSAGRLQTLQLAAPAPSALQYHFSYSGDAGTGDTALTQIIDPIGRVVTFVDSLANTGATKSIVRIGDPDKDTVRFTTDPTGGGETRILSRTDKRGTRTTYGFGMGAENLGSAQIALSGLGKDIIHTFLSTYAFGQAAPWIPLASTHAVAPESVYVLVHGPRINSGEAVGDTTRIWIDRWWQPTKIADAHDSITTVRRDSVNYPNRVTQTMDAHGRVEQASYDARGNIASVTDYATYVGGFATTSYQFDPKWDSPTSVRPPDGTLDSSSYDPSTGNLQFRQDLRGPVSRDTFSYDPSTLQLSAIKDARGNVDHVQYDAVRANPSSRSSPIGFVTTIYTDTAGRDTLVQNPVDSAQGLFSHIHTLYDHMDRDSIVFTYGPPIASRAIPAESVTVKTIRDPEGAPLTVTRTEAPDAGSIGTLTTTYHYDPAGRVVQNCPVDTNCDIDSLDAAGNVVSVTDRRQLYVHMVYDALNRLTLRATDSVPYPIYKSKYWVDETARDPEPYPILDTLRFPRYVNRRASHTYVIAADTATFKYDALGRMLEANNKDAQVGRSYNLNGTLATDTLRIRTVATHDTLYAGDSVSVDSEFAGDFATHQYVLTYTYDIDSRRTTLSYPSNITSHDLNSVPRGTVTYGYDVQTGALTSVTDMFGNVSHYYDGPSNNLDSLNLPGLLHQSFVYDPDDRLIDDSLRTLATTDTNSVWHTDPIVRATGIHYDARGKVISSTNTHTLKDKLVATYTGLGQIDSTAFTGAYTSPLGVVTNFTNNEVSKVDALGNKLTSQSSTSNLATYTTGFQSIWLPYMSIQAFTGTSFNDAVTYVPNLGRSATYSNQFGSSQPTFQRDTDIYDASGNLIVADSRDPVYTRAPKVSFYSADGKLRAIDSRSLQEATDGSGAIDWYQIDFEQYRYDALGRRVWVRSRKNCHGTTGDCYASTTRRIIFDGSSEIAEISALGDSIPELHPGGSSSNVPGSAANWENDTPRLDSLQEPAAWTTPPSGQFHGNASNEPLSSFYGRTLYVSGRDGDHPLEIIRLDYNAQPVDACPPSFIDSIVFIPSYNYNGIADNGSVDNGQNTVGPISNSCGNQDVAAPWAGAYTQWVHTSPVFWGWFGSVVQFHQDATGLTNMRNRYYDSRTGRFTQEDPIGLAGGLNAYGFAAGDPVNYSDPFGLCPPVDHEPCNMNTGDPNLDNPTIRQNLEDKYKSSPDDKAHPGYKDETAGYCTKASCTGHSENSIEHSRPGTRPSGAVLEYHTHPNVGMADPDNSGLVYLDGPSDPDLANARSPNRRGLSSYIVTPQSLYRLTPNGQGGTTSVCFQRWTNSSGGCQ